MEKELFQNYRIIDAHAHIFPEKIAENATVNIGHFYDLRMDNCGVSERLIEAGSTINVERYLVCSTATTPHQTRSINTFIKNECDKHSEFFGLGTTHPDSEDLEGDIQQIIELGLHGVKLHPDFQKFDADSPEAYKIYELIEGRLPLLIHCGDPRYDYSAPTRIANIAKDFPKLKIQAAHMGGYQRWSEAEKVLIGFENVAIDISSSMAFMPPEKGEEIIRKFGVDKSFFGCDFPMWNHMEELERFFAMSFTDEERQMILAGSFEKFYGIV